MARKQQILRWDGWVITAVEEFGKKNKIGDFSKTIRYLIRVALNRHGYYEENYTSDIIDKWQEPLTRTKNEVIAKNAEDLNEAIEGLMVGHGWTYNETVLKLLKKALTEDGTQIGPLTEDEILIEKAEAIAEEIRKKRVSGL